MSLIFISLSMILGTTLLFLSHPLSLGLILLSQTIIIALMTGLSNYNYWFSYIIFLIMIGGMLILFIYMTSVASNEKFKFSYKLMILLSLMFFFMMIFMLLDFYYFNLNLFNSLINQSSLYNYKLSMNKFLSWPMNLMFFFLIIYLLLTLIMVVKITNIKSGPLRQNF
uniref:NADH dehydrogenase subunit 6 n=1 Tax=Monochamus guttulatus TaxID=2079363 RepID=UPI0030E2866B